MPTPVSRRIARWFFGDTSAPPGAGVWGWLRPKWRLIVALVGSAFLTWPEWVKHHPPEIAIVAVFHVVFVLIVVALICQIVRWFQGGHGNPQGQPR